MSIVKLRPYLVENLPPGLVEKLNGIQGRRRTRVLRPGDVARISCEAFESDDGWDYWHGGSVANSYKWPACTTLCLAVRLPSGLVAVDVAICNAKMPSPGKVWDEVRPWDESKVNAFRRKLVEWATSGERFVVDPELIHP